MRLVFRFMSDQGEMDFQRNPSVNAWLNAPTLIFRSIMDIFGTNGSDVINSLAGKMILQYNKNMTSMNRTAILRSSFAVERKADLNVIINLSYMTSGGRPLVHVVAECPRDYHVAYLTRTGWPLLSTFNWNIMKYLEAGGSESAIQSTATFQLNPHFPFQASSRSGTR